MSEVKLLTSGFRMKYLLYLPERKALYFHIPRTGGTWVKDTVRLMGIRRKKWWYATPDHWPKKHPLFFYISPEFLSRVEYMFAFVRHPVDYYVSMWRVNTKLIRQFLMLTGKKKKQNRRLYKHWMVYGKDKRSNIDRTIDRWKSFHTGNLMNEAVKRWKPDFNEWMEEMLEEEPGWVTRWFERYVGPDRGEFPHFIGRTETLDEDMGKVMDILGYEKQWKRSLSYVGESVFPYNRVQNIVPLVEMSEELRERVERSERVFIRRFYGKETSKKRVYRNLQGEPV